ncbi:MBL fold metallo-hydrolase [Providencia burhodogranariea]|uniref:Metallo-beta-lactamase domain-containing protein n=1 Tax=Providencia burhodogranariea DSM 19968 TaxID=1141662 RepID=K8X3A2_9GAMM|nr:MBL fold metallo-hydrolase [Providencia burhodogranariea]EKT62920.1 hypothetical protein OOA_05571 [Providencia burhodogranariea DSM 19968]
MFSRDYPNYPESANYDNIKKRFINPQELRSVTITDGISGLFKMLGGESQYAPKATFQMEKPDWSLFLSDDGISRFIWLGHSTLLMRIGKQTIVTDPVLGSSVSPLVINMRRFQKPAAPLSEWPQTDVVLISHNHYDHFESETLQEMAKTKVQFIVPLGMGEYLKPFGIDQANINELDWWQTIEYAGIHYTLVPALHNSGRSLSDSNKSFWGGYIVQQDDETIYYSGDSAYGPHFTEIAQRFPNISIAFIENGQYDRRWPDDHMLPEKTVQAAVDIKPRRVVPVHWGAYTMAFHPWNEPVRKSIPLMKQKGLHPLTPYQGQVFDAETKTQEWFLNVE